MTAPIVDLDRPWSRRDLAVVLTLVATAIVIAWPILAGGWLTYLDNPAHIAELRALASPEGADGWSELAFAGLSLDSLHSPLFWRGLALLDRVGITLEPMYAALTCLAVAAPAVALYAVARKRLPLAWAAGLAYLLLVQRSTIIGTGSATGGMWTMCYATAALILLADRLARPSTGLKDTAVIGALLGFIGLTHLFVLEAAVVLFVVHHTWVLLSRRARPDAPPVREVLRRDVIAGVLAVAAAFIYWFPVAISQGTAFQPPQNLSASWLVELLVAPTDALTLMLDRPSAAVVPAYLEALPQVLLVGLGLAGIALVRRRHADPLAAYGAGLALAIAALLAIVRIGDLSLLGPNSWRFLYFIRVGCALAAIPACAWLIARLRARRTALAPRRAWLLGGGAAALAIASGLVWGAGLRKDVVDDDAPEIAEVRALWTWLRDHRADDWGRVYLQDTFFAPPMSDGLARSHLLALTLSETGLPTIGPFYGVVPSTTAPWTIGELGLLFGRGSLAYRNADGRVIVDLPMAAFGASHVVTAGARWAAELERFGLAPIHRVGRFTVFRSPEPLSVPVGAADGPYLGFQLETPQGGTIHLAHAFHPFWRVAAGPPGARLQLGTRGRMALTDLPPGTHDVALEYRPPRVWPVSVAGWLGIVALYAIGRRRWRRAPG